MRPDEFVASLALVDEARKLVAPEERQGDDD